LPKFQLVLHRDFSEVRTTLIASVVSSETLAGFSDTLILTVVFTEV